jgi:hypothetical protein
MLKQAFLQTDIAAKFSKDGLNRLCQLAGDLNFGDP